MWSSSINLLASASLISTAAAKYDQYILAPSSRTIHPVAVYQGKVNGTVTNAESIAGEAVGSAVFTDVSAVTYDFGKSIGGVVTLEVGDVDPDQFIGLTVNIDSMSALTAPCLLTCNIVFREFTLDIRRRLRRHRRFRYRRDHRLPPHWTRHLHCLTRARARRFPVSLPGPQHHWQHRDPADQRLLYAHAPCRRRRTGKLYGILPLGRRAAKSDMVRRCLYEPAVHH